MATNNSTAAAVNSDVAYVAGNQLADAAMFIQSAMRLIESTDSEAYCLLDKAHAEIIAAQDYLENLDPIEAPISKDVASMLGRIGKPH